LVYGTGKGCIGIRSIERDEGCVASVISSIASAGIDAFGYLKAFDGLTHQRHGISGVKTRKRLPAVTMQTLAKRWKIAVHVAERTIHATTQQKV
jgi:hypothetical protein